MLTRKLLRTALSYKAQFISMIIMITLGMGMFLGFNMEWKTIEVDTGSFFELTNYADYRLYSEKGFTKDDIKKISKIKGVNAATRYLSVNLDIKGEKNKSLALDVSENYKVSTFTVTDGAPYDKNGEGFWLSDKFAANNKLGIGDKLTLVFQGTQIKGKIVGLIKSGEHMICVADKNQMMPDYNTFGYAYISPKKLKAVLKDKIKTDFKKEFEKTIVPKEFVDEKLTELFVTDEMLTEAETKAFSQINLLSDMDKRLLKKPLRKSSGVRLW
ncbi:MAG: hypothetical protein IIU39_06745 [Ruminococcus sp.]|nr:hypothetical protein [Ruminococcus sp.]